MVWEFIKAIIPLWIFLNTTYLLWELFGTLKNDRTKIDKLCYKVVAFADVTLCIFGAVSAYIFIYLYILLYEFVPRPYIQPLVPFLYWFQESALSVSITSFILIIAFVIIVDEGLTFLSKAYRHDKFLMRNFNHLCGIVGSFSLYKLTFQNNVPYLMGFLSSWGDLQPHPNW